MTNGKDGSSYVVVGLPLMLSDKFASNSSDAGQAAAVVARLRQDGAELELKLEDERESRE